MTTVGTRGWVVRQVKGVGSPPGQRGAIAQLKEMMAQMGGDATRVAQEMVTVLTNAPGSPIWDACKEAEDAWVTQYPKLSAVGRLFFFAAFGYGLSMVVQAFGNWANLSDEDRAKLVGATVGLGIEGLLIVPEMLISVKDMGADILNKINAWRYSAKTQESVDQIGKTADENYLENGLDETSKLFNAETKSIEAVRANSSRESKVSGVVGDRVGSIPLSQKHD